MDGGLPTRPHPEGQPTRDREEGEETQTEEARDGMGGVGEAGHPRGAGRWRDSGPLCDALPCARPAAGTGDGSPAFRPPRNPCWGHRSLLEGVWLSPVLPSESLSKAAESELVSCPYLQVILLPEPQFCYL